MFALSTTRSSLRSARVPSRRFCGEVDVRKPPADIRERTYIRPMTQYTLENFL